MIISYEITQQFLLYLIDFLGFVMIFVLPAEYIIKCHIDEVRSWGTPQELHVERVISPQVIQQKIEAKEIKASNEGSNENIKSTTKTKRTRKKKKEIAA